MIQFNDLSVNDFLNDYWQKKPLLIRGALPNFISPVSPEELAGLSLEEDAESRIVVQHSPSNYELKTGPFTETVYETLPEKNWTLLVQGMDRLMPEVADLLKEFSFIPSWRIDDIMISYATEGGNVGPHFDHYDVFLLQAQGKRNWQLTSKDCEESNYIQGVDLRLMQTFEVEDDDICEAGDILYIPPKWGHYGISLTDDCMTFSIGYRTYRGLELWDSLGDYLAEKEAFKDLYIDPNWQSTEAGEIPDQAWQQAKFLLKNLLDKDELVQPWFGRFATQLDQTASELLPQPFEAEELPSLPELIEAAKNSDGIIRDDVYRFAYMKTSAQPLLFVNSQPIETQQATEDFIKMLCNQRVIDAANLKHFLNNENNHTLFQTLWNQQAITFI